MSKKIMNTTNTVIAVLVRKSVPISLRKKDEIVFRPIRLRDFPKAQNLIGRLLSWQPNLVLPKFFFECEYHKTAYIQVKND